MKVLLINKFLYPKGGDAIVTLSTGDLLQAHGHHVVYWGMKDSRNKKFAHDDLFIDEVDLNAERGEGARFRIAGNMLYSMEAKRKIEVLIKRIGRPDLVHLHNYAHQISPSIIDVFRKHSIPCVMTMHDYKMVCASYTLLSHGKLCEKCMGGAYVNCFKEGCVKDSKAKSLLNTVEMYLHHKVLRIYEGIDLFISPSRFLKDKVCAMGFRMPVEVLPNFIRVADYKSDGDVSGKTICYIGRLSKEKGVSTLIEALEQLPDVHLKIIGDGPMRAELQEKVRFKRINNVNFLGHLSSDQLKEEVRACRLTVCPSEWYENNPRSIIESFAMGKPVIGARIGGIPELVRDNETGLTFESGNARELASVISELISNPRRCAEMGKHARRWVEEELNPGKHYERLMDIYRKAIGNKKQI